MIQESISPTKERLSKGDRILPPEFSQTVKRPAYRKLHKFEELHESGRINDACFQAANKLVHHYYGSLGHDVRLEEWAGGGEAVEYPVSYHGQMLAKAREYMRNASRWSGLMALVEERRTLAEIGADWLGCKDRAQSYIAGMALVRTGLDDLSVHWQFSQSYHARPPNR